LYIFEMNTITATNARQNWADTIESAKSQPVLLTDHGRPTVVMMNAELARLALQVLDDSYEMQQIEKALKAEGRSYTIEEVAAELGIELDRK
jgi:PHD/YefM family antitoxin component YafN of YafNO toxin-antitoxin module